MASSPLPMIVDDIAMRGGTPYDIDEDATMDDHNQEDQEDREEVFMPVVQSLVTALGGFEEITHSNGITETIYRPGDSALPVLRSLKRLWRKDDTDDERTVARCFAKAGLARELIALLEECAERGEGGRKMALAAADLLAALTWPIDVSTELKDLEDEPDVVTDYASLLRSQVEYKAMMLRSGETLRCLMIIMIPSLAKPNRDRTDKDRRIVSLMLHLIRNLLAIRDPPSTLSSTSSGLELSRLQSELIGQLETNGFLTLLLTLGGMAGKTEWNDVNVLVLDILWSMYKGVRASELIKDQTKAPIENLTKLLEEEDQSRRSHLRNGSSRHSRFGTTIAVQGGGAKYILHKQKAISASAGSILDSNKRQRAANIKRQDEGTMSAVSELSVEALKVLQAFAVKFLDSCFNAFFESILKDIRMSRSKIRDTDNLRTLYLTRFFVEYFLLLRTKALAVADIEKAEREKRRAEKGKQREMDPFAMLIHPLGETPDGDADAVDDTAEDAETYPFGLIGVMAHEDTIRWMQRRLTTAIDGKISWVELQACMSSIGHLLSLTESMAGDSDDDIKEAAAVVKDKVFYDATTLESAVTILKLCHDRPVACQEIVIDFAFVLLRTLEKYSQSQEFIHVRKRKNRRRQKHAMTEAEQADLDEEEAALEDSMPSYQEHRRTFRQFEEKYINEEIAKVLVLHADHYQQFKDGDHLKRLVGLMHRIGVKRQAEGIFFKVSILRIFKRLLDDKISLSRTTGSKNLLTFINYILRKFFKAAQAKPMLFVEVFFPLTKSIWKEHSTYQSDEDSALEEDLARIRANRTKIPAELEFKPDRQLSWSEQMGVAVRCLLDEGKMNLITWLLEAIALVGASRQEIILHTDGEPQIYDPDLDDERPPAGPSAAAKEKIEDHAIDFDSDDRARAATYDPHFRLMLKLVNFASNDSEAPDVSEGGADASLLAWHVPRGILPENLEASARIIEQFLREPFDLDGENAQDMLRKKRKKPVRRRRSPSLDGDGETVRRPQKQTEVQHFKSAAFIDDSDDDEEADREFFAREAQRREANRAAIGKASMLPHGKKKSAKGNALIFTQELASSMNDDSGNEDIRESTSGRRTPPSSRPGSSDEGTPLQRRPKKRQRRADPDADDEQESDGAIVSHDESVAARSHKRRVLGSQSDEDGSD